MINQTRMLLTVIQTLYYVIISDPGGIYAIEGLQKTQGLLRDFPKIYFPIWKIIEDRFVTKIQSRCAVKCVIQVVE